MFHYRKTRKQYKKYLKPASCPFCRIDSEVVIDKSKYHVIVPNIVFYDVWEMRTVTDHLLVLPKRHVGSLAELTREEKIDHMDVMARYEADGYNIYARGLNSPQRSVPHQHTHLIKTATKPARLQLIVKKPYLLIKF